MLKRKKPYGLLQPNDINGTLAAIGLRIEESGRESNLKPSQLLFKLGIVLPENLIDSWDFINIGRFAEVTPSTSPVASPDFQLSDISEIEGENDE
jgi:hypothetical protein